MHEHVSFRSLKTLDDVFIQFIHLHLLIWQSFKQNDLFFNVICVPPSLMTFLQSTKASFWKMNKIKARQTHSYFRCRAFHNTLKYLL